MSWYSDLLDLTEIFGRSVNLPFRRSSLSSSPINNLASLLLRPYSISSPFHHEFKGTTIPPIEVMAI